MVAEYSGWPTWSTRSPSGAVSYTHLRAHETDSSLFVGSVQMCIRDRDLVAVEAAEVVVGQLVDGCRVLGMAHMVDPFTLRGEQLDQLRSAVSHGLGDGGGQRCHGSGMGRVLRHRDFVVAHRCSLLRGTGRDNRRIASGHRRVAGSPHM